MAGENLVSTLSGLFKEVYADQIGNLVPDGVKLLKLIKFESGTKETGNLYHQPVLLSHEHGITYSGPSSTAFSLNAAVAAVMQDAQITGSQVVMRSAISYEAAARASNDKKAFKKATTLLVENMVNSISKRLEVALLYGQQGIGQSSGTSNVSATTTTVTIKTASWAPGIWSGLEGAVLVAYSSTTRQNAADTAGYTVSNVDLVARTFLATGSSADITQLDAASGANKDFYFLSAATGSGTVVKNEFAGLDKIITNTTTLFNIDANAYALWKGNSYSAGTAQLSLSKILAAVALGVERGLDEDVVCLMSAKTWANIASDQAALRVYDSSYKGSKLENGASEFVFNGQNGKIEIHTSIYVKEGEAFILPLKRCKRIGAMEVSFKMPGRSQEEFFLELQSSAGYELRAYTDQALFVETPSRCIKITNIVNS
jgi:hypothetical protein